MNLGMKINIVGWVVFAISFIFSTPYHEWVSGIATGLFIAFVLDIRTGIFKNK